MSWTYRCESCGLRFTPNCAKCNKAKVKCPRCGKPAQKLRD